jgi:hypothetical protein
MTKRFDYGEGFDGFGNERTPRPHRPDSERSMYQCTPIHHMWRGDALERVLKRHYEITAKEYFEAGVRICR